MLLSVARIAGYPSGLGIAMRVRKNALTANIRAEISYMRMCASLCVRKWRMAIPNRDGTVSAIGLYIGMHWPGMRLGSDA